MAYDVYNDASVYEQLRDWIGDDGSMDFDYFINLMTTVGTFFTIFLSMFLGPVFDRYGMAATYPFTVFLVCFFEGMLTLSLYKKCEISALVCEAFMFCCVLAATIQKTTLLALWMSDKKAFGMSLLAVFAKLGGIVNHLSAQQIAKKWNAPTAYLVSVLVTFLLGCLSFSVTCMEKRRRVVVVEEKEAKDEEKESFLKSAVRRICALNSLVYWCTVINYSISTGAWLGFMRIANSLLTEAACGGECCPPGELTCARKAQVLDQVSYTMTTSPIVVMVLAPFCGLFVDKYGKRGLMIQIGFGFLMLAFGLFYWTSTSVEAILILHGIACALISSAILPIIVTVCAKEDVSTAFSVAMAIQAITLTFLPLILAKMRTTYDSYYETELLFFALVSVGFIVQVVCNISGYRTGNNVFWT
eukprot:CAMPEP_0203761156 /NCGR_PEP_ID=MMETSP0098-20131031/14312_1 /ASSEMBLY_ACC=CAM_ASM_000208 /TAXON_ID=96639 /ORGANISM=" , Strain NY0313808BC1" /LENGTH=414 /DNA_ID=CAMNT_0050655035 /DNA_START=81 /DNA_END=1325 /DNA_ORIENTATION=-